MREKLIFFSFVVLAAITIPAITAGAALLVGQLVGMADDGLLLLVGSAATATFTGVLALAALAAMLMFSK